jgi:hypothetical protein
MVRQRLGLKMVNSDSIVDAIRTVYIEEGNDTPFEAAEWLSRRR